MPRGVRRFPETLYITREKDRNSTETYLIVNETVDDLGENGQIVGVYKLTGTKRLTVTKTLKGA